MITKREVIDMLVEDVRRDMAEAMGWRGEQHDAHVRDRRMAVGQAWLVNRLVWDLRRMMKVPVT